MRAAVLLLLVACAPPGQFNRAVYEATRESQRYMERSLDTGRRNAQPGYVNCWQSYTGWVCAGGE